MPPPHTSSPTIEQAIQAALTTGAKQRDIAQTYALGLQSKTPPDWKRVNQLIMNRWPKGLERIKNLAHKLVEQAAG